jgi:cytochrome c oxidase subunit II
MGRLIFSTLSGEHRFFSEQGPCFFVARLWYTRRRLVLACGTRPGRGEILVVRLRDRGYWGMGLALMVLIWLITLVSTYFFVAKTWWLPAGASAAAGWIDHQFALTFVIMGIVFLAAQLGLGYIVWRYRETPASPPVTYSHGNTRLEIIWTILTAVLFIGLNLMGSSVWASQRFDAAESGAVQVEVTGMQFAWYFRYPGPDGKYGPTSVKLMDPSSGGEAAVGLNTSDPAAKDDVVTGTMYLPVDREVDVSLRSVDVIHSFFVPNLRFKQDAVPGLNIHMHFKPTVIGEYEIACAELCGLGHYKMHGMVHVVSQEDFDKWLAAREAEKQ